MDLILWRHADAADGEPDLQRELTVKGHRQAQAVAGWLNQRLPEDALILSSPARRTQQTADALGRRHETLPGLAPGADAMSVLLAAGWPESSQTVVVIGHQPTLGRAVMLLLSGQESEFSLKKGGLAWISNRVRQETSQNILRAVISPELL